MKKYNIRFYKQLLLKEGFIRREEQYNISELASLVYEYLYDDYREFEKKEGKRFLLHKYQSLQSDNEDILSFQSLSKYINNIYDLENVPGLYFIYNANKHLIYIGKSNDLSVRSIQSFFEREGEYIRYAITETRTDAVIYEAYYITKLKPMKNTMMVDWDNSVLNLPELEFTEFIQY